MFMLFYPTAWPDCWVQLVQGRVAAGPGRVTGRPMAEMPCIPLVGNMGWLACQGR